jgi:hypothetical protein
MHICYNEVQIYSHPTIILLILMHICLIQGATNFPTMIGDLEVLDSFIASAMNHENEMDEVFKDYLLLRSWAISFAIVRYCFDILCTWVAVVYYFMHGLLAFTAYCWQFVTYST